MRRLLIVQQGRDAVAGWTLEALLGERKALRSSLDLEVELRQVDELERVENTVASERFDALFLATHWKTDPERVVELTQRLRPSVQRFAYLDTFDPTSSPVFGVLPFVDLYLKKQLLKDREAYANPVRGGYVFADWCAESGLDLAEWHFGSLADPAHLEKLELSWNLGTAPHLRRRWQLSNLWPRRSWRRRGVDVHYRVSLGDASAGDWYTWHRQAMHEAALGLEGLKVVAEAGTGKRITAAEFRRELGRSRIVLSPMGYGEVTDRDYEVVLQGAVLFKPDVSHLETFPDIYRKEETYVPLRWDLSDTAERCYQVLDDPERAQAMAAAARSIYSKWFREGGIIARMRHILERLDLAP